MYAVKSKTSLAAGLFLALASVPAIAQDTATRSETAAPGKSVRILIASNLKDDCKPGSMPEIRISTSPKNGSLITKTGSVTTPSSHKCPNKKTAATGVFYQSKDGVHRNRRSRGRGEEGGWEDHDPDDQHHRRRFGHKGR